MLNLRLFDLRREPVLREARHWFIRDFHPESIADVSNQTSGERATSFAMVVGYWDMAASLVTTGAIDAAAFCAAHSEVFAAYSKIEPFLAEIRAAIGEPGYLKNLELLMESVPDAKAILARRRAGLLAMAKTRKEMLQAAAIVEQ